MHYNDILARFKDHIHVRKNNMWMEILTNYNYTKRNYCPIEGLIQYIIEATIQIYIFTLSF